MHNERRLGMLEYGKLSVTLAALAGFLLFTYPRPEKICSLD